MTQRLNKYPQHFVGCDGEALKFNDEMEKRQESLGELEAWGLGESCWNLVSLRGSELLTDKIIVSDPKLSHAT